jgi:(p)ppGpp synthase/HD superfamily hydrolase
LILVVLGLALDTVHNQPQKKQFSKILKTQFYNFVFVSDHPRRKPNMTIIDLARQYATSKHFGQQRIDGSKYIEHPIRVYQRLVDLGIENQNILCAALLHDTLEDTETTKNDLQEQFGNRVLEIVEQLTSNNEEIQKIGCRELNLWKSGEKSITSSLANELKSFGLHDHVLEKRLGKALYLSNKLNQLAKNDLDALLVKLSDRLDNLLDAQKLPDKLFFTMYCLETEFLLFHLDWKSCIEPHATLLDLIGGVVIQCLENRIVEPLGLN